MDDTLDTENILEEAIWSMSILDTLKKTYSNWTNSLKAPTYQQQLPSLSVLQATKGNSQKIQISTKPRVSRYILKKEDFLQRKSTDNTETKSDYDTSTASWLQDLNLSINKSRPEDLVDPCALNMAEGPSIVIGSDLLDMELTEAQHIEQEMAASKIESHRISHIRTTPQTSSTIWPP